MLLKELLKKNKLQQKDLADILRVDEPYVSNLANYKYLPTPEQANKICTFLNCNILDIYNKKEIDLILGTKKASRNNDDNLYYRLCVRLNKSGCNCLKIENLHKLGYKTMKEWVLDCMESLKHRLKEQDNLNQDLSGWSDKNE